MRGSLKLTIRRVLQQEEACGGMMDMGRDDDEANDGIVGLELAS